MRASYYIGRVPELAANLGSRPCSLKLITNRASDFFAIFILRESTMNGGFNF